MLTKFKSGLICAGACALSTGAWLFFNVNKPLEPHTLTLSGFTMGTRYQIQIVQSDTPLDQDLLSHDIQQTLAYLDKSIFSTYAPDSELSRFNRSLVNQPFNASMELLDVISKAKLIHQQSNQSFDITISPLVELWGFGSTTTQPRKTLPTATQINRALAKLGTQSIVASFDTKTLLKTRPVQIDLSGIAKGYAVDQIAALLTKRGLNNFLVEIGGELKLHGSKPDELPWVIAIESPDNYQRSVFATFTSKNQNIAVAGSGDYRNYFELAGQRFSHQLDPATGWPINHDLVAVTVIDQDAATADAYATALMVLGSVRGYSLASENNLAAYFIMRTDSGYERRYTGAFSQFLPDQQ